MVSDHCCVLFARDDCIEVGAHLLVGTLRSQGEVTNPGGGGPRRLSAICVFKLFMGCYQR